MAIQNTRIFWPVEAVGIAPFGTVSPDFVAVRGVQAVGLSGRLPIEYIHELGNLPTYCTYEDVPEVEATLEKLLDGYPPVYCLATQGATTADLIGRSNQRCHLALSVHRDNQSRASGNQIAQITNSGMYLSSVGYDFTSGAPARESVTLVGNNSAWSTGSFSFTGMTAAEDVSSFSPAATEGVNRRQHLLMTTSRFPTAIPGISSSGTNEETVVDDATQFGASFQSIRVAANLGRTPKMELGRRAVYVRHVEWPVEVSCTFEFAAKDGDMVDFLEANEENAPEEEIKLYLEEGLALDLGTKNRLTSKSHSGGQAGGRGSDVMLSFSYSNHNELTIQHPADPTVALRP